VDFSTAAFMIDFPNAPTDGQVFSATNGVVYKYSATYSSWLAQNPTPPLGGVGQVTATSVASTNLIATDTVIPFATVQSGNAGLWWNTTTNRYTPPAGSYFINANLAYSTAAGGNASTVLSIRKNGAVIGPPMTASSPASFFGSQSIAQYVDANGTDYFEVVAHLTSGSTTTACNGGIFSAFPLTGIQGPTGGAPGPMVGDFATAGQPVVTTTAQAMIMPVVNGNSGSYYNSATGRWTPPAGRYNLYGGLGAYSNVGNLSVIASLRKNGIVILTNSASGFTNGWGLAVVETQVDANGSDYFDLWGQTSAAATGSEGHFGAFPTQGMVGSQGPAGPPGGPFLRNSMAGFVHSHPGGSQSLTVGAGQASDSTNAFGITSGGNFTKTLATWVAGSGNGGMGTGLTVAINTWYFPFAAIIGGAFDIFFDTTPIPTHIPAGTTAYRRLRPIKTDGSSNILAHQAKGDLIQWVTQIAEAAQVSNFFNLVGCPPGIQTTWQGRFVLTPSSGAYAADLMTPGTTTSTSSIYGNGTLAGAGTAEVLTDTTPRIAVSFSGAVTSLVLATNGFIDNCGRYD
jgi:hypothetical protein